MIDFMKMVAGNLWYFFISCVMVAMTICVVISVVQGLVEFRDWLTSRGNEDE